MMSTQRTTFLSQISSNSSPKFFCFGFLSILAKCTKLHHLFRIVKASELKSILYLETLSEHLKSLLKKSHGLRSRFVMFYTYAQSFFFFCTIFYVTVKFEVLLIGAGDDKGGRKSEKKHF